MSRSARPLRRAAACLLAWALLTGLAAAQQPRPRDGRAIDPPWAGAPVLAEHRIDHDPGLPAQANGARLQVAVDALRPGDRLTIGGGTWVFGPAFRISPRGTADAPVRLEAAAGERVVLTRADATQNVIDLGWPSLGGSRFVRLAGLEITGGSAGLRLHQASNVWVDGCEIHHVGEAALTANTHDTSWLYLTRNHIHHTQGTGEGMYLGANHGAAVMSHSVIALNHVHHTGGHQGDGIEIKQGSFANWVVANHIHDTRYPCLILYGTDGREPNLVERNRLVGSETVVLQVQGEALVRNNLVVGGPIGFHTHDHQGQTRDLVLVHNTVLSTGLAADLQSWSGRPGMVLANNVLYSLEGRALEAPGGLAGVTVSANRVLGSLVGVEPRGLLPGGGLGDFVDASWDGSRWDVRPAPDGVLPGAGDRRHAVWDDLFGRERGARVAPGCADGP